MVRNKLEGKDKLTPWEQFLEKKKDKRKQKKNQKVALESNGFPVHEPFPQLLVCRGTAGLQQAAGDASAFARMQTIPI